MPLGGWGGDNLKGGSSEDLLIGGGTAYDVTDAALSAIMTEWTAKRPFLTRIDNLTNGVGATKQYKLKRWGR